MLVAGVHYFCFLMYFRFQARCFLNTLDFGCANYSIYVPNTFKHHNMHAHRIHTIKYKIEYHWNLSKLEKKQKTMMIPVYTSTTNSQTLVYHSQFHRFSNHIGQQTNDNRSWSASSMAVSPPPTTAQVWGKPGVDACPSRWIMLDLFH